MKFKPLGKLRINDEDWEYGWGDAGKTNGKPDQGMCNYEFKRIVISRKHARNLLDVLSHEILHARFPDIKEESINDAGELIAKAFDSFPKQLGHGRGLGRGR